MTIFLSHKHNTQRNSQTSMIIVPIKEGENIERALKRYKRKYNDIGIMRKLRKRQAFQKPSDVNRRMMEKARYVQSLRQEELDA